ncbi:Uncharacterized protein FKW44_020243, partial [Caligus rogercresseyi]
MEHQKKRVFEESTLEYLRDILRCNAPYITAKKAISSVRSATAAATPRGLNVSWRRGYVRPFRSVLYSGDLQKHLEEECIHRRLPCVIPTCESLVAIKDIVKHVDRDHVKSDTFMANGSSLG